MIIQDRFLKCLGNWKTGSVCAGNDLASSLEVKRMLLVKGASNLLLFVHFNKVPHVIGIRTLVQRINLYQGITL